MAFRRKMDNSEVPGSVPLASGQSYKVLLQFGLFKNGDDQEKTNVKGAQTFEEAMVVTLPTTIKEYVPYTGAQSLIATATAILLGLYNFI